MPGRGSGCQEAVELGLKNKRRLVGGPEQMEMG